MTPILIVALSSVLLGLAVAPHPTKDRAKAATVTTTNPYFRGLLNDIVAQSEKSIIYVGTRKETVCLAKVIQTSVASLRHRIGFYHGGMLSKDRATVEETFRTGYLKCTMAYISLFHIILKLHIFSTS